MVKILHISMQVFLRILDFTLNRPSVPTTLFGIWLAILYQVSNRIPTDMPEMLIPNQDKILHFCFFLGGGVTLAAALRLLLKLRGPYLLLTVAIIMGSLGALDEFNQQFVPGRSGLSLGDWIADLSGSIASVGLLRLLLTPLATTAKIKRT